MLNEAFRGDFAKTRSSNFNPSFLWLKHTEEKNSDKNYSFQFVLSGMSLMDILSFTDTGATRLVLDLYS